MNLIGRDITPDELEEYLNLIENRDGISRDEWMKTIVATLSIVDAVVDQCWGLDSTQLASGLRFQFNDVSGNLNALDHVERVDLPCEGEKTPEHNKEPSP